MRKLVPSLFLFAALSSPAWAGADVGGYFRVMTRPDLVGGDGKLGYWNLYGRLLNEGPYGAVELKLDVLERQPTSRELWTDLHVKVEGGSIAGADAGNGGLGNLRLSQVYVQAGNLAINGVTWRMGTLESNFGDLGLYDMRLAQVLTDTVGVSARYEGGVVDALIGVGDAGYTLRPDRYNSIVSPGGTLRVRAGGHVELGAGAQAYLEPEVVGNRNAPYTTPGLSYDDYVRRDFVADYAEENPGESTVVPRPGPTSASSYKGVFYLGFGSLGPLTWNNLFGSYTVRHPDSYVTESYNGVDYDLYVAGLTDERTVLLLGDELQLRLVPERLDLVVGALYGLHRDADNNIAPSDDDRRYWSAVARAQVYLSPVVHLLGEGSYAEERSHNGKQWRNHYDSLFANSQDPDDPLALQFGDADVRTTIQGKGGLVLNPLGPGIYTRPSLRILYGIQWSSQNNAFGNSYVESLDQYNYLYPAEVSADEVERHVHQLVALEAEVWF